MTTTSARKSQKIMIEKQLIKLKTTKHRCKCFGIKNSVCKPHKVFENIILLIIIISSIVLLLENPLDDPNSIKT